MINTAKKTLYKRERTVGICLACGLIIGAIIGSISGNVGWWVWLGTTAGACVGVTYAIHLK